MAELDVEHNPVHPMWNCMQHSRSILKTSRNCILTKKKASQALMTVAPCTNMALMLTEAGIWNCNSFVLL